MDESKDLEFPSSSSSSAQQTSGGPQRVGTYIIERTIGKGNFSFVKLARHTVTNVKVAIKIIDKTKLNDENLKKAQREADILKSLHHPNIIKLYQVMESEKLLCIVTEYLPNGELYEYIAKNGYLNEQVARHKFMEILSAVEHCHLNNVVHRDLKAENMLLDQHMSIKLADFGFGTFQPSGPDLLLTTWCGSPPYAAPEIFKGEPYLGVSADIWSLGVILYVLVCGVLPFNAQEVSCLRRQVLEEHVRVPYWLSMCKPSLSFPCEDLLKRMLAKSPSKRPSIAEIYNSKWLSEINDPGSVPFPLALDEPDSAVGRENLSASLGSTSAFTAASYLSDRLRSSFASPSSPTLAAEMKSHPLSIS
ncbi:unnamed protein product [Taenia asiatica]|uniref:non-specific serine/threonine protein kinase n=1 Tax=Taenia asiatica TaxID=60517 RepID=A0A0R3WA58_TAEAS|nr:unnamed protein product [Taenia asiatica]